MIGEGQESCIYDYGGEFVLSVFKEPLSPDQIENYNAIALILKQKDPYQRYFVSGTMVHAMTPRQFQKEFPMIDLNRCTRRPSDVFFVVLPKLMPIPTLSIAQKKHLIKGLQLLHQDDEYDSVVHGDIKKDNIMLRQIGHEIVPVFIDFGQALIWPPEHINPSDSRSPQRDNSFLQNVFTMPPSPIRKARPPRSRSPRSRSPRSRSPRLPSLSPGSPPPVLRLGLN